MKKFVLPFAILFCISVSSLSQSLKTPSSSPPQTVRQDFGLSSIELSYSRPGVKGRKIFGDLVPFGKVWRTGANSATTLTFGDDVMIGGKKIQAGKYGLLTIPGADEWTFILTHQLDVTSPAAYRQDQDVLRVTARPGELPFSVETFTILFSDVTSSACNLQLVWDKTAVTLPIQTEIDSNIMSQISDLMNKDNRPYFAAALYYLDNGKDLNQALDWFNKAIVANPKAFFMFYQKAKCLATLGKKQDAIATARQSMQLAKDAKNDDYVLLNEKLIDSIK